MPTVYLFPLRSYIILIAYGGQEQDMKKPRCPLGFFLLLAGFLWRAGGEPHPGSPERGEQQADWMSPGLASSIQVLSLFTFTKETGQESTCLN